MKVTIEFNLPEQQEEYEDFMNGVKWKHVVREIDEYMRETLKWNSENLSTEQLEEVKGIRGMLVEYMDQGNLTLHK